ncbi:hypothetical protein D1872_258920 [compost metagenome]
MTNPLQFITAQIPVGQYGIVRIGFERTGNRLTSRINHHMAILRSAFSRHQIIPPVNFIHMRALQIAPARSLPNRAAWRQLAARLNINFALNNTANPVIVFAVAHKEDLPVFKIQIGIDSPLIHIDRFRPLPVNIVGPYIKVLVRGVVGRSHVKSPVMMPYRGSEDAARAAHLAELNLALPG